jgi:hypothetical protein
LLRATVLESISMRVIEKADQPVPPAQAIADGLGRRGSAGELDEDFLESSLQRFDDRRRPPLSRVTALFGAGAADIRFDLIEFADVFEDFAGDRRRRRFGEVEELLAVVVVGVVIAGEPALQLRAYIGEPIRIDLLDIGRVARQLDDHTVWIGGIDRPAIAMLQNEGLRLLQARRFDALPDFGLGLRVDPERDMMERRERYLRPALVLVALVCKLEERQGAAVADAEKAMAIDPHD